MGYMGNGGGDGGCGASLNDCVYKRFSIKVEGSRNMIEGNM